MRSARLEMTKAAESTTRSLLVCSVLSLPGVAGTAILIRSGLGGDDFQPARWLATGGPTYGESYLFAYPLPAYLPSLPLAMLPITWSHAIVFIVCLALLGMALWFWRAPWMSWFLAMTSTPVIYALMVTHLFSSAALLGCSLAVWASGRRRVGLLGFGLALAAIRPVNTFPVLAVIAWSWRAEWKRLAVALGLAILAWTPFTVWAFALDPRWPLDYLNVLRDYPIAGVIRLVYSGGTLGYIAVLVVLAAMSVAIAAVRGHEAGAVVGMALSVAVAPLPGTYAAVFALPALMVAGRRIEYQWFPGIVSAIGWVATILLLELDLPPAIAAYWYVVNCYPILRAPRHRGIDYQSETRTVDVARPPESALR
jgi:hypothetical protein